MTASAPPTEPATRSADEAGEADGAAPDCPAEAAPDCEGFEPVAEETPEAAESVGTADEAPLVVEALADEEAARAAV